jgi:NADPH:quinone reductase
VIAAASSAEKRDLCSRRGADQTLDYSIAQWRTQLTALTNDRGIDVVYDPVGGSYSEIAFRCLAPGGRHLVVGFASGVIPRFPLNLPLLKKSSIVGVDWGGHVRLDPAAGRALVSELASWVTAGKVHPEPNASYPLEEAGAVLQRLLDRSSTGKPVIRISR